MSRKKRSSWGSVQKLSTNRYRLRWIEAGTRKSEIVHGTRREAEDRLAALRVARAEATESRVTVEDVYNRYYLPECKRTTAEATQKLTEGTWERYVLPRWGNLALDKVKPLDVQEWLLTLTASTAPIALKILRGVYRLAMIYELADKSPVAVNFERPTNGVLARTSRVIEESEMEVYYSAALAARIPAVFILCACAGLRVGEALGVRVGEIERETVGSSVLACVPVARQVGNDGSVSDRLKTPKSARWSACGGVWAGRLLELQAEAQEHGDVWLTDNGLGCPAKQSDARRWWMRELDRAGLERVPLQNLRPTYATHMGNKQAPVESVARLMGHSKPTITYGVYERPTKAGFVALAASLDAVTESVRTF